MSDLQGKDFVLLRYKPARDRRGGELKRYWAEGYIDGERINILARDAVMAVAEKHAQISGTRQEMAWMILWGAVTEILQPIAGCGATEEDQEEAYGWLREGDGVDVCDVLKIDAEFVCDLIDIFLDGAEA